MLMAMVLIGSMRMGMDERLVHVHMSMRPARIALMGVLVVAVIMNMRVVVHEGLMRMLVRVPLRQMQHDPEAE